MAAISQLTAVEAFRRGVEYLLAASVLTVAFLVVFQVPLPFPSWPTIGPFPVNPELVLPGALALVVLVDVIGDGFRVSSVLLGTVAVLTLGMATQSLYALFAGQAGGVFWGGFFTLVLGTALGTAVVARDAIRVILSVDSFDARG
ncbi:MAG: hypothetical protein ACOCR0_02905 [Haloferacaceae archaeon]